MTICVDEQHKLSQLVGFHKPAELQPFFLSENYSLISKMISENYLYQQIFQNYYVQLYYLSDLILRYVSSQSGLSSSFEISFMWRVAKKGIGTGRRGKVEKVSV